MKKKLIVAMMVAMIFGGMLTGCGNQQVFDTNHTYDTAIIQLANGEIVEVKIKSWNDYDGEQLQVVAEDGTVYLTSSFRCDLINSKE